MTPFGSFVIYFISKCEMRFGLNAHLRFFLTVLIYAILSLLVFNKFASNPQEKSLSSVVPVSCGIERQNVDYNAAISSCNDKASELGFHQRVVSFSFYGREGEILQSGGYVAGILENLRKIRELYPGFLMRIYTNVSLSAFPPEVQELQDEEDVFFCNVNCLPVLGDMSNIDGMIWRFLPLIDPTVDIFLVRDLDSAVNERELSAVEEWIDSDKIFHGMRDNPSHNSPVMGGMWGAKNYLIEPNMREHSNSLFIKALIPGMTDQDFLKISIYASFQTNFMIHDSYLCKQYPFTIPFPKQRTSAKHFVGGPYQGLGPEQNVSFCPEDCRPTYGKDWIYC